ncbi:PREDICTED: clathrin light chain 3-like [Camelina sativa]|uniref:Clathrin light chain n=1 Tax=Camelina sativa TaxID=90675 RepID=A0ABM0TI59_CAMSA|nr:PREDICTED: clathrin light chain 3-like [Camelina sativa]
MSSSLSNDESGLGESNPSTGGDGGNYTAYESRFQSQRFDSSFSDFDAQPEKELPGDDSSPLSNQGDLPETQTPPFINGSDATNGSILPPPSDMEKEEGFALREWRRLNALRLEEKEKKEKEMVQQIIETADQYKADFYSKRNVTIENNMKSNREKEKLFLENQEKFYAEADKNNWKAIAELIPREVPVIESRGKNKKKPAITVIQGPKPGKPTDLSRMRQVLTKLKHNPPTHMKPKSPSPSGADSNVISEQVTATEKL